LISDLDGDGRPEVIAIGQAGPWSYLCAWRYDGQQLNSHFPIQFASPSSTVKSEGQSDLLAVDLDRDGKQEILTAVGNTQTNFFIRVFSLDGTSKDWPTIFPGHFNQFAAADLERDGHLDVILSYYELDSHQNQSNKVWVLNWDGSVKTGWPV